MTAPLAPPATRTTASDAPAPRRLARPPRASRAAAPALPPLERLDRTHAQMLAVLDELRQLVEHLADNGVDGTARANARRVCRFFTENARQHHADEEALVFPPLVRSGDPALIQDVLRLQQDHGWLEEDWLELEPQLQAVAEGYSWYDIDALRHGVGVFTTLYQEHIGLEESLIYPAAKRRMDAEAAAQGLRAQATSLAP